MCQSAQDFWLQSRGEEGGHVAQNSGDENQIEAFRITGQNLTSENEEHILSHSLRFTQHARGQRRNACYANRDECNDDGYFARVVQVTLFFTALFLGFNF